MCIITLVSADIKAYDVLDSSSAKKKISFNTVGKKTFDSFVPEQQDLHMFIDDDKAIRFTDEFLDLVKKSPNGLFFANRTWGYWYGWTWDPTQRNVLRLIQMSYKSYWYNGTDGVFNIGSQGEIKGPSPRPKRQLDIQSSVYHSYVQITDSNGKTKQRPTNVTLNLSGNTIRFSSPRNNNLVGTYDSSYGYTNHSPIPYSYYHYTNPWYYSHQATAPWWTGYYNYLMGYQWY